MLEGSCLCGGVRYGITGGLVGRINYCHCSQCRKASGSRCGSPLFKRVGNSPEILRLRLGTLDTDPEVKVGRHI